MLKTLEEARRLQKATGNVGRAIRRFLVRVTAEMQNLAISTPMGVIPEAIAMILARLSQQRDTLECCCYGLPASKADNHGPQGFELDSLKPLTGWGVQLYGPFLVADDFAIIQTKFPDMSNLSLKELRMYLEIVADVLESFASNTPDNLRFYQQAKPYPDDHIQIYKEASKLPVLEYSVLACLAV